MQWLQSFVQPEFKGKALQRNGDLTREQLMQFFEKGRVLMESHEFQGLMRAGHQRGNNVQDMINDAQMKVWEEQVEPAVQGDYGINYLGKVRARFGNDAEFLKVFYSFVELEERVLDQAELPVAEYTAKYQQIDAMKASMEAQMEELSHLTEEQRQKALAEMYKRIVDASLSHGAPACCRNGACTTHVPLAAAPPAEPMQAPTAGAEGATGGMTMER